MKYCIGCIHWHFSHGEHEPDYSTRTGGWDTPAHLSCKKGHWGDLDLDEVSQPDIERAMEKAETCPDFSERSLPDQPTGEPG